MIQKANSIFYVKHNDNSNVCIEVEINYSDRSYSIRPNKNIESFTFKNSFDLQMNQQVIDCIHDAIEHIKQELS